MTDPLIVFSAQLLSAWLFGFGTGALFSVFKNFFSGIFNSDKD